MQNATPGALGPAERRMGHSVPALALAGLILALVVPRAMPGLLLLVGAPVVAAAALTGRGLVPRPMPWLLVALGLLGAYLFVNSLWSVEMVAGLLDAAFYAVIVGLCAAVGAAIAGLADEEAARLQRAVLVAAAVGALFLAIETPLGQPIRTAVVNWLPFLRPPAKHAPVIEGRVAEIRLYTLNRNLAVLNLLLWPALLLARARLAPGAARLAAGALVVLTAVAVLTSEHETSMIALVVGCLVFLGMLVAAPVVRAVVLAGWIAATMLVVPAAMMAHQAGLHQAQWLPQTARNRIVLWEVTTTRLREAPLLGVGIDSTKPLDEEAAATAGKRSGDDYPQRTGRHAHNIFMQTWYELGAVGAVLLLAVGVLALRALARLRSSDQPYAYASFVSAMVIGAFSWGMWQPWFMAAFGVWVMALLIGLDAARRGAGRH